jgi:acyl carrier protein
MHKEALSKYREVLRLFKKYDKDSLDILDIMVEISKLYLHLGDI